jgi:hypothetical protein
LKLDAVEDDHWGDAFPRDLHSVGKIATGPTRRAHGRQLSSERPKFFSRMQSSASSFLLCRHPL